MKSVDSRLDVRFFLPMTLAILLAACGGGGGEATGPEDPGDGGSDQSVAAIEVRPDTSVASSIDGTVQFEAEALDGDGDAVSGVSFSWSSSDGTVAAVDGGGTTTARANGAADIEASARGASGSGRVVVRSGELTWARVHSGNIFTCGVTTHGRAYCWGDNVHGELGNGSTAAQVREPVLVRGQLYFVQLALGGAQICARNWEDRAYCWGNSSFGEGGYGETRGVQTTTTPVSGSSTFQELVAGSNHTCGLTTDGQALCWGHNHQGQLGDGTNQDRSTPVSVAGGLSFEDLGVVTKGSHHTCGVTDEGAAYCWGQNGSGQLGDGTTADRTEPVRVDGVPDLEAIAPGGGHTCGLTADGAAYCWGQNSTGQLGDGTTEDRLSPVEVSGGHAFELVTAGRLFTCGLTADGTAYCWGFNGNGELGDGTNAHRSSPVQVTGDLQFQHLEAGEAHACGVTLEGDGYCWGNNDKAQLGPAATGASNVPVQLPDPSEIG